MVADRALHAGEGRPTRPGRAGFETAVDDELPSGDPGGLVAGEEHRHVGDVDCLAHPAEHLRGSAGRSHLVDLALVGVGAPGGERRGDEPRTDGVDTDAVLAQLEGDRPGQMDDRALATL